MEACRLHDDPRTWSYRNASDRWILPTLPASTKKTVPKPSVWFTRSSVLTMIMLSPPRGVTVPSGAVRFRADGILQIPPQRGSAAEVEPLVERDRLRCPAGAQPCPRGLTGPGPTGS